MIYTWTLRRKFNGAKLYTEAWDVYLVCVVGERSVWGEVIAKAGVDCKEVRMPE